MQLVKEARAHLDSWIGEEKEAELVQCMEDENKLKDFLMIVTEQVVIEFDRFESKPA